MQLCYCANRDIYHINGPPVQMEAGMTTIHRQGTRPAVRKKRTHFHCPDPACSCHWETDEFEHVLYFNGTTGECELGVASSCPYCGFVVIEMENVDVEDE